MAERGKKGSRDPPSTQDTLTLLRSAIRKLLRALQGTALGFGVRMALSSADDYASPGKPPCDWDDPEAREQLVDALVRDALAALGVIDGKELDGPAREAAELLALVAGQDVEADDDGVFRIARRVAKDRVVSTVDPEARHGHKSRNRRFDGYKAHLSVDPDSELIDDVVVTPANTHDAEVVEDLLAGHTDDDDKPTVMGDSAYAGPDTVADLEDDGFEVTAKVPPASNRDGRYSKDDFDIDVDNETVGCPAGHIVTIRFGADGGGRADFAGHRASCPRRKRCTTSTAGRSITIHPREALLQRAKAKQATPEWQQAYRSTRPKVERKIAHFARSGWGARRARTRGVQRVGPDAATRAAAVNWARLATLGITLGDGGWTLATT